MKADTPKEAYYLVSILNAIVEQNGFSVDDEGFGYDPETLDIRGVDDTMEDMLEWVWNAMIATVV